MALTSPQFVGNQRLQNAANNAPPLKKGEKDRVAVGLMQQMLIDLGYSMPITTMNGAPDGIYGDETVKTVWQFQSDEGLQRDGQAGHDTLHALDRQAPAPGQTRGVPIPRFPPLTTSSTLICQHGGSITAVSSSPPISAKNPRQILTVKDQFIISGCQFFDFTGAPSPCSKVNWVISNGLLLINGVPTLNAASVGLCTASSPAIQGRVIIVKV